MSALTLSESFYVTSFKDRKLTKLFISFKDSFILEESDTTEEDGTLIEIPLVYTKANRATLENFYDFYLHTPSNHKSNEQLQNIHSGEPNLFIGATTKCIIRVGGIPYTQEQISNKVYEGVYGLLIDVPIGSVTFSSSREHITSDVSHLVRGAIPYIEEYLMSITDTVDFKGLVAYIRRIRSMLPIENFRILLSKHVYKGKFQDRYIKLLDMNKPLDSLIHKANIAIDIQNLPSNFTLLYPVSAEDMTYFINTLVNYQRYKVGLTQKPLKQLSIKLLKLNLQVSYLKQTL